MGGRAGGGGSGGMGRGASAGTLSKALSNGSRTVQWSVKKQSGGGFEVKANDAGISVNNKIKDVASKYGYKVTKTFGTSVSSTFKLSK